MCAQLSSVFPSATDMSLAFVRRLVDDILIDQQLPIRKVAALASAFLNDSYTPEPFSTPSNVKCDAVRLFKRVLETDSVDDIHVLPSHLEKMSKSELQLCARSHTIAFERRTSVSDLRDLILHHILSADCLRCVDVNDWVSSPSGCAQSLKLFLSDGRNLETATFIVFTLAQCAKSMSLKPLRRILTYLDVPFDSQDSLNQLRRRLNVYMSRLQKSHSDEGSDLSWRKLFADLVHTHENWPQVVSSSLKDRIRSNFLKATGSAALKAGVCASCAESCLDNCLQVVKAAAVNLDLLRRPGSLHEDDPFLDPWLNPGVTPPNFPFDHGPLSNALVDP